MIETIFAELSESLKLLYLKNTSLSTLSKEAIYAKPLPNWKYFAISTNNFYCDCNVDWIMKWIYSFHDASLNIQLVAHFPKFRFDCLLIMVNCQLFLDVHILKTFADTIYLKHKDLV